MNIYQPYTYLIGWVTQDRWYYGVRYKNGCHSSDLWVDYFTSSQVVKSMRVQHGEPDVIQIRKTFKTPYAALAWETIVLQRMGVGTSDKWMNLRENRWPLPNNNSDSIIKEKLSKAGKGRKAITNGVATKYINAANVSKFILPDGWWWGSSPRGEMSMETRQKISIARLDNPTNRIGKFKHTDETKRRLSEVRLGVPCGPMSELHKNRIRQAKLGHSPSDETRQKISNTLKGRPGRKPSDETRRKLSQAGKGKNTGKLKGMKWITNGIHTMRVGPNIPLPSGYWFGRV